jgi:hypothetical protein
MNFLRILEKIIEFFEDMRDLSERVHTKGTSNLWFAGREERKEEIGDFCPLSLLEGVNLLIAPFDRFDRLSGLRERPNLRSLRSLSLSEAELVEASGSAQDCKF